MKKEIGIVGLGKMGANTARRLIQKRWKVVGLDYNPDTAEALRSEGVIPVSSYAEMAATLSAPRVAWVLVPAGKPVDDAIFGTGGIVESFSQGDIIVDAGNSFFKDSVARAEKIKERGMHFIDVGSSGGPFSILKGGGCLMVGGDKEMFATLEPVFQDLARPDGYRFFPGAGAGHFIKMVHNGIEYGMMQSIAEGFEMMKKSDYDLNLTDVADIYNHGSIIEARLVGWLEDAFKEYGEDLESITSTVAHTGEGEWTAKTAKEMGVDVHSIEYAFQFRLQSEKNPRFAGKVLSALRNQFGGHKAK